MSLQQQVLEHLAMLLRRWKGQGRGYYPTIASFEYEDEMEFIRVGLRPLIFYRQWTFDRQTHETMHIESGFINVLEDGTIQINNSQDGGRNEVLVGQVIMNDSCLELQLSSKSISNDERLVATKREFTVTPTTLSYKVFMGTHRTGLQQHLEAHLQLQKDV